MARVKPQWRGTQWLKHGEQYYADRVERSRCCDCGLIHEYTYRIEDADKNVIKGARLKITTRVNKRATAAARRGFKFEKDRGD